MENELRDPIFKGCTRPAMVFGVPLVPFVLLVGTFTISGVGGMVVCGPLSFPSCLAALAPLLVVLRALTRHDDQRLHQILVRLMLLQSRNKSSRHATYSYGPFGSRRC
jgi:type IV secretion system protein VirB3